MARELRFDTDAMRDMKKKLEDTAAELEEEKERVLESMGKLKENWNTPAGKKFIENVDLDWADEVEKYIKIIEGVKELLSEAISGYGEVEGKVDRLKFY